MIRVSNTIATGQESFNPGDIKTTKERKALKGGNQKTAIQLTYYITYEKRTFTEM